MLTDAQITQFKQDGFVTLPGMLTGDDVLPVQVLLWQHFEKQMILRTDPSTWPHGLVSKLQPIAERQKVQSLATARLMAHIAQLMDQRPLASFVKSPMQLLVTFPDADEWQVPSKMWHLDIPRLADDPRLPGVQPFIFVDDVAPGSGGTVIVSGSHHLLNESGARIPSAKVKHALVDQYDWFARLMNGGESNRAQFLTEGGRADDVPVKVVELTGKAGDVILMDMRVLHAPAPNASSSPRIMATARYVDEAMLPLIYGAS